MKDIFRPNMKVLLLQDGNMKLNADMESGRIEHMQFTLGDAELNFFAEDIDKMLVLLDQLSAWRMKHTPSRMKNPPHPIWFEMVLRKAVCQTCANYVPWYYRKWDGDAIVDPCVCPSCSGKRSTDDDVV